jgi:FtsH-binding integral membrane protein
MNPVHWKREHQIAFLVAAVIGAGMGIYIGVRQVEPSTNAYWLHVGLWGVAGMMLAAAGAFIRQLIRNRNSNRE